MMQYLRLMLLQFVVTSCLWSCVLAHGRLMDPPSRGSMWRMGFKTPKNYNDNQLYCGGFTYQWKKMKGKCGVCGDPFNGPRLHEAGGMYATGTISRTYKMGQVIEAKVDITANHKGYFQFKICPNNNPKRPVTQECLDQYPLMALEVSDYKYMLPSTRNTMYKVKLQLPQGLTCSQCVLQWVYTAGNNWGVCEDGKGRTGCGPQEQFRGCSDVAISADRSVPETKPGPQKPYVPPTQTYVPPESTHHVHPTYQTNAPKPTYVHQTNAPVPTHVYQTNPKPTYQKYTPKPVHPVKKYSPKPYKPYKPKNPFVRYNRPNRPSFPKPIKPQYPKKVNTVDNVGQPSYINVQKITRRPEYNVIYRTPEVVTQGYVKQCMAIGVWKTVPGMNKWCVNNCKRGHCPPSHCRC